MPNYVFSVIFGALPLPLFLRRRGCRKRASGNPLCMSRRFTKTKNIVDED